MKKTVEMVAFDLDGVIADTEPLHRRAKERIFAEIGFLGDVAEGIDLDDFIGLPNSELWTMVLERCGAPFSPAELERRQYDAILEQLRDNATPPSRGLFELLERLEDAGVRCGMFSSSDFYYVERVLSFFGLSGRFSPLITGDRVARRKPAPDGYLRLIEQSGLPPSRIVAVEDSRAGVASATAAGLRCIGYANPTSGNQNLEAATLRVAALGEIPDRFRHFR